MAGLGELLTSLFSKGPAPPELAPPLTAYPSPEDAAFAQKYGFGYGDPRLDTSGNSARVLGVTSPATKKMPEQFNAISGARVGDLSDLTGAANDSSLSKNINPAPPALAETINRAALAANRIPIAGLGFDPSRMVADTQIQNPTVGGAYSSSTDGIYFNMPPGHTPSTPVHESIHRGLEILRKDPANAEAFKNSPDEESIVRYLMAKQAGDPEQGSGAVADRQRKNALTAYDVLDSGRYARGLSSLTQAAVEAIARRRPGGPR